MQTRRTRGLVVALLASALVTSACGLKPEVKDQLAQGGALGAGAVSQAGGEAGVDSGTGADVQAGTDAGAADAGTADAGTTDAGATGAGTTDAAAGSSTGGSSGGSTGGSAGGSTGGSTGSSTGGSTGGTTGGAKGAPAAEQQVGPNSKVGVDDKKKTLKIFLHGPLTGAGVPQDSFISGTPKYWKGKKVKGFTVEAEAFDDKYQPGPAVKACNSKAKEGFLIIGGAGTDQIQACARSQVLRRGNVPYLSAGVTTNGLTDLGHYFATSLTYADQARLVVAMAKKGGYLAPANGKGWAVVVSKTPNFADAQAAIVSALKGAGQKVTVINTPKTGGDSTAVSNQLREGDFKTVYFLGQPTFFIELVGKAGCPAYCPQWTGVGVSMGTNSIGSLACRGSGNQYKGEFLSPMPGLDKAGALAPGVRFRDDIEFGIYATMQVLEQMLKAVPGDSFTRESFITALEGKTFTGKISGTVNFSKGHFGGTGAHALKMNCGSGQHVTNGFYT
jgi:hypothetical protein